MKSTLNIILNVKISLFLNPSGIFIFLIVYMF